MYVGVSTLPFVEKIRCEIRPRGCVILRATYLVRMHRYGVLLYQVYCYGIIHTCTTAIPPFPSLSWQGMLRGMSHQAYSEWGRYFWQVYGQTHPQGVLPSYCWVWRRGLLVAVELGRTGCVRHGHLRFVRLF